MQTISNAWRTDDLQTSRGHPLLKKASFAIYADHFKRWRTDDYQCSQSSSQSSCRPSRQSSQSQPQPRDRLLRRDELPDLLLLLAMLPTSAPAMNSSAPFVPGDISYSLLRASSAAFFVSSISRTRASWRFMSASSLAQNSSRIRAPLLDLVRLALKHLLIQRGITLHLLADAADFIAVALPRIQDKGYAQYGYYYYRYDCSNQRAASYIHKITAA